MNVLLDSPLEALAFNYVSFGIFTIVNNLWTWVAVITAAVSFWRIRAAGAATSSSCSVKMPHQKPSTCITDCAQDESRPILEAEEKPTSSALVSAPASVAEMSTVSSPLACHGIVTKGMKFKLSVHYEYDTKSDVDGELTVTEWGDGDGECKEWISYGEWWESWERALRLRMGETGWYRNQDLTAINGNVVRLWDECRRGRHSSSSAVADW